MKKLFVPSLILAILLAAGWEVLSYYESQYTGLVVYGHLLSMNPLKDLRTETQMIVADPNENLVVMRFEGKPQATREPEFYMGRLIDTNGNAYRIKTALWPEKAGGNDLLVFSVPESAKIEAFQFSDQPKFPMEYFQKFAWLRFRNWFGRFTLAMIAIAIVLGILKHFQPDKKKEEHVDPFDFINKAA